jgi:hypothetical protein
MEKGTNTFVKILEAGLLLGVIATSGRGFRYYKITYTSPYRNITSSSFYHANIQRLKDLILREYL